MKTFVLSILALTTFSISNGQYSGQVASSTTSADGGFTDAALKYVTGDISDRQSKLNFKDNSIQGSPYTANDFTLATLYYDDEVVGDIFYRYNAYNEEVEMKQKNLKNEAVKALAKDKKISIDINGKPLSFKTFIDKNNNTLNGYLMTLEKGDEFILYKRANIKFTEGQKAQNSFVKAVPAKFSHFTEYYIEIKGKNRIDEIQLRNRQLLKMVPSSQKDNLANYIEENNINIKNENDLKKVFEFLNS